MAKATPLRGRKPLPSDTPLAKWLAKKRWTRTRFAAECSRVSGLPVLAKVVCRWAAGEALPDRRSRALIALATAGEVAPESWLRSRRTAA